MRLKLTQVESLAKHIFKQLESQKLVLFQASQEEAVAQIASLFRKNIEEEIQLEEEARRLLEQNRNKLGLQIDEEKAFLMIKRQLAKEKNFVL